jgi:hypothetical protein
LLSYSLRLSLNASSRVRKLSSGDPFIFRGFELGKFEIVRVQKFRAVVAQPMDAPIPLKRFLKEGGRSDDQVKRWFKTLKASGAYPRCVDEPAPGRAVTARSAAHLHALVVLSGAQWAPTLCDDIRARYGDVLWPVADLGPQPVCGDPNHAWVSLQSFLAGLDSDSAKRRHAALKRMPHYAACVVGGRTKSAAHLYALVAMSGAPWAAEACDAILARHGDVLAAWPDDIAYHRDECVRRRRVALRVAQLTDPAARHARAAQFAASAQPDAPPPDGFDLQLLDEHTPAELRSPHYDAVRSAYLRRVAARGGGSGTTAPARSATWLHDAALDHANDELARLHKARARMIKGRRNECRITRLGRWVDACEKLALLRPKLADAGPHLAFLAECSGNNPEVCGPARAEVDALRCDVASTEALVAALDNGEDVPGGDAPRALAKASMYMDLSNPWIRRGIPSREVPDVAPHEEAGIQAEASRYDEQIEQTHARVVDLTARRERFAEAERFADGGNAAGSDDGDADDPCPPDASLVVLRAARRMDHFHCDVRGPWVAQAWASLGLVGSPPPSIEAAERELCAANARVATEVTDAARRILGGDLIKLGGVRDDQIAAFVYGHSPAIKARHDRLVAPANLRYSWRRGLQPKNGAAPHNVPGDPALRLVLSSEVLRCTPAGVAALQEFGEVKDAMPEAVIVDRKRKAEPAWAPEHRLAIARQLQVRLAADAAPKSTGITDP